MRLSRPVMLAVAAVVAACSTGPSPFAPSGPPGILLLVAPTRARFGTDVTLSLTNASAYSIMVRLCPFSYQRWNGFGWEIVGDGGNSCSGAADTIVPGAEHDYVKEIDVEPGVYKVGFGIQNIGPAFQTGVTSNVFTVTQ